MATSKKKPGKKTVQIDTLSKGGSVRKGNKVNVQEPVKIIIEIVIKNETTGPGVAKFLNAETDANLLQRELTPPSNFSYSFTNSGASILTFIVEGHKIDNPPDSGDFFERVIDPNDPQQVLVVVIATKNTPTGSLSLNLKYQGKNVFEEPEEIVFSGGKGRINKFVNLPK